MKQQRSGQIAAPTLPFCLPQGGNEGEIIPSSPPPKRGFFQQALRADSWARGWERREQMFCEAALLSISESQRGPLPTLT